MQLLAITAGSGRMGVAIAAFTGLLKVFDAERVVLDAADPSSHIRITLSGDADLVAVQAPCSLPHVACAQAGAA